MNKADQFLSRHFDNDDHSQYEFVRDTKLPHGTFDKGIDENAVCWAIILVFGTICGIAACFIGSML